MEINSNQENTKLVSSNNIPLKLIIVSGLLLIAYIILSIISGNFSIICQTTDIAVNGKIESHQILDYPYSKKIFEIFSTLCLTALVGILISILISKTIEKQRLDQEKKTIKEFKETKEREIDLLNQKINESVFNAILKKMVPDPIFYLINEQIFKTKAIRKNAHWFFNFTEASNGSLDLSHLVNYELENVGLEVLKDPVILNTDKKNNVSLNMAHATVDGMTILNFEANKDIINDDNGERISINSQVIIGKDEFGNGKVEINTEIPSHKVACFTLEYFDSFETDKVTDGYFTKYPIIDVLIKFTYPINWDFNVFFTIKTNKTIVVNKPGSYMIKIDGGFLPGQGCVYTLKKINNA